MHYRTIVIGLLALSLCAPAALAKTKTDRERAELRGLVNTVLTEQEITDVDGDKTTTRRIKVREITYDKEGNLTEEKIYYSSDVTRVRKPERISAEAITFVSEMGNATERYKFDKSDNVSEKTITYGADPNAAADETIRYTHDKKDRVTQEEIIGKDGSVENTLAYTRDAKGHVVGVEQRGKDAQAPYPTLVYTYEFDKQGNWVKRTQTVTNVPPEDIWKYSESQHGPLVRTFTYYPAPPKKKAVPKPPPAPAPVAEQPPATTTYDTSPIIITP
ncbi:MAG: hypothetical protein ACT4OG_09740 [Alphaproteobacteria bacterium]